MVLNSFHYPVLRLLSYVISHNVIHGPHSPFSMALYVIKLLFEFVLFALSTEMVACGHLDDFDRFSCIVLYQLES